MSTSSVPQVSSSARSSSKMVKIKPQNKNLGFDGSNVERFLASYEMAAEVDGASEFDMAYQLRFFILSDEVLDIVESMDGFESHDWSLLKAGLLAHWGKIDTSKFTTQDLEALVHKWSSSGGVSSVADFQSFRKSWEPIQSYLVRNDHIDTVEEIRTLYYRAFSPSVQERIRDQLVKDKTMITTRDNRFKLPVFKTLRAAIDEVMRGQTALTFEESRSSDPVPAPSFKEANEVMKKIESDRRPTSDSRPSKEVVSVDEISKMLQSFEQRMEKKISSIQSVQPPRGPMVCFYCHREGHGTVRCTELQKDKEAKLVEQKGNNFFLPNGALIPFDSSRPIRHVVATYTPPRTSAGFISPDFKASCGTLQPWYPPAISSQSFSGAYQSDPARKRHEDPKPFKAPAVPASASRRPVKKSIIRDPSSDKEDMEVESEELFERINESPNHDLHPQPNPQFPSVFSPSPADPVSVKPKVRFERGISKEHPNAIEGVLKKISDLKVPDLTVAELLSVSPSVAEGMKKWVSRRKIEIGSEEMKVSSGTLVEDSGVSDQESDLKLYSCPLGFLPCLIGDSEASASPLVDSGSQLNLISDSLANKFNISPRVSFTSAVYGIGNQACELVGIAEDVPIRIGRSIVGYCHFWITRLDGPLILGRPFLIDFDATLVFSGQVGERILIPDSTGRKIEVSLCASDSGRWEREFPGKSKALLVHCVKNAPDLCNEVKLDSFLVSDSHEWSGSLRRQLGVKVSPPNYAPLGQDATKFFKTLPRAINMSNTYGSLFSFLSDLNVDIEQVLRDEGKLFSFPLECEGGMVEFGPPWRQFGAKVSPPNCAPLGQDAVNISKTLPCATYVSEYPSPGFSFSDKSPFENREEHQTWLMLERGLCLQSQLSISHSWKNGEYLSFATKYKPVSKKIKPINQPMPLDLNPPLNRPPLSRDPYFGLSRSLAGPFVPCGRVTEERLAVVNFGPKGWLLPDELNLIKNILALREKSIAFCEEERGLLKDSYGLPYIIPVVEHEPWQKKKIPIPAAKVDEFIKLIRERVRTGLYEQSTSSYSSPVFCVLKSNGKLRVVHDLQPLNKVTIKDAGVPPATEEFVESFSGRACYGLGDIMGGYDERALHPISRPLTTFDTPLGRYQLTRLPQGATNSVAVYQAQMMWILQDEIPDHVGIFIDDGGIKGPPSDYDNEFLTWHSGIRRFIWEYATTLERILFRIEESGLTVSGSKLAACVPALEIVGHVVCKEGRRMAKSKVNKILSWPTPVNPTEVRGFLGVVVYVRIFIPSLSQICLPLRRLTRKDSEWIWTKDCEDSFQLLKEIVGKDIVLVKINYGPGSGKIKLAVDSSYHAAGAVLTQEDQNGLDRPALYESLLFSDVESRYSQPKLELCGVARILKKLQTILWGQHFELQVDAKSLIEMINSPSLPNAPMTRWVAFIQLFSFDIVHCQGKSFTMPDGLSRRPIGEDESDTGVHFDEEEPLIKPISSFSVDLSEPYSGFQQGFWRQMETYLSTLEKPPGLDLKEFHALKRKSINFFVQGSRLMKRGNPCSLIVVTLPSKQAFILESLHESLGHRGETETYRRVSERFWWPGLKKSVSEWCKSCELCQKRDLRRPLELRFPTGESTVFGRVSMDAVHIKASAAKYLIVARDDFSGWVEARFLKNLTSESVASFLYENWTMRFGLAQSYSTDGGSEFGGKLAEMLRSLPGQHRVSTPYYPEGQGMVERGHGPLKSALVKLSGESGKNCRKFLPLVLFADRISTKRTTGYSPYEIVFGQRAVLPLDLEMESFLGVDWDKVSSTSDLLVARSRQLERSEETRQVAYEKMMKARRESIQYWENKNSSRLRTPLNPGDLVLAYNRSLEVQWGKLFSNRWNGPYLVVEQVRGGSYILSELDGTLLARRFSADQVKRFFPRGGNNVQK